MEPGQVCVLDNGGRDYCTVWGGYHGHDRIPQRHCGTLIYGVCRDIKDIHKIDNYYRGNKLRMENSQRINRGEEPLFTI